MIDRHHEDAQSGVGEGNPLVTVVLNYSVRRAASARSEDGRPIARGVEVVVTRFERGIAYVRAWEEISEGEKEN